MSDVALPVYKRYLEVSMLNDVSYPEISVLRVHFNI
jgi:hypothetical protein